MPIGVPRKALSSLLLLSAWRRFCRGRKQSHPNPLPRRRTRKPTLPNSSPRASGARRRSSTICANSATASAAGRRARRPAIAPWIGPSPASAPRAWSPPGRKPTPSPGPGREAPITPSAWLPSSSPSASPPVRLPPPRREGSALEAPLVNAGDGSAESFARLGDKARGAIALVLSPEMKTEADLFAEYGRDGAMFAAARECRRGSAAGAVHPAGRAPLSPPHGIGRRQPSHSRRHCGAHPCGTVGAPFRTGRGSRAIGPAQPRRRPLSSPERGGGNTRAASGRRKSC